jgi:hypothetical protein
MLTFILLAVAFFVYPGWVIPFFRAAVNNLRADFGFSVQNSLEQLWPIWGGRFAFGLRILLLISLGYEIAAARRADFRRFYWAACFSIAVAPLLGFRTEMENLAVLILPFALIFAIIHERWSRIGTVAICAILILALAIPWAIYLLAIPRFGNIADELLFLFYPLLTLVGIYWVRWWAIRPPRTWFDRAKVTES